MDCVGGASHSCDFGSCMCSSAKEMDAVVTFPIITQKTFGDTFTV